MWSIQMWTEATEIFTLLTGPWICSLCSVTWLCRPYYICNPNNLQIFFCDSMESVCKIRIMVEKTLLTLYTLMNKLENYLIVSYDLRLRNYCFMDCLNKILTECALFVFWIVYELHSIWLIINLEITLKLGN